MNFSPDSPARIILAVDHPGWAYHNIASQIATRLQAMGEPMTFQIAIAGELRNEECDVLICFDWKSLARILANNRVGKVILCVYDHVTWCTGDADAYMFSLAVEDCDLIAVANEQIADMMRFRRVDKKPVYVVEDGVDLGNFTVQTMPGQFTVGWAGNSCAGFGTIKGLGLIQKACEIAKAPLVLADLGGDRPVPHQHMGSWYSTISCYVCASKSEGTPNPVLEAAACGRPVVTTRCGIAHKVVTSGINGYIVERTPEAIADGIKKVRAGRIAEMASMARVAAEAHDWAIKVYDWRNCIRGAMSL